jgi:hypothetical protein
MAWRIHGLSVEGYRHRRAGVGCQDAWDRAVSVPPDPPLTVLAVADGAGSRPCSAEGAKLAVSLATRIFSGLPGERAPGDGAVQSLLLEAFHQVREEFLAQTGDADGRGARSRVARVPDRR